MEPIRFLVFTFQLAFTLAVFDPEEIDRLLNAGIVTWEIARTSSKKISLRIIQEKPEQIIFDPQNAYIVLHKRNLTKHSYRTDEYYLVSEHLSKRVRHETLEYVIVLWNTILIRYKGNVHLIRETYNRESFRFKLLFPRISDRENPNSISQRRLYRASKVNGELRFQQVPLQFSQLTSSNAYVYVDLPLLIHFKVNYDDPDEDSALVARHIMSFIELENEFVTGYNSYHLHFSFCHSLFAMMGLNERDICYSKFLSKLEQCPDAKDVETTILNNVAEAIPDVPDYQLYSPSESKVTIMDREFTVGSLDTFDFTTKACYVFVMPKVAEIFIYIRDLTDTKQLRRYLKFGEELSAENKYLVSVFQKEYPVTPFIFIFKKFKSLLLHDLNNSDLSLYRIKNKLNEIRNNIIETSLP